MWQREVPAAAHEWEGARATCACLSLAGHDDWRLPTRIELVSLVDFTRSDPAIDPLAFPGTPPVWFWTSTPRADDPSFAWFVYFENGYSNHHQTDAAYRVRCVRDAGDAPPAAARYLANADGTVRDQRTGLTWQRDVDPVMRPWEAARAHCAALPLAGGGWRLPSMKELQTLVDDSRAEPSIDPLFPDTPLDPFWTASPVVATPGSAWRVSFIHGYTYDASGQYEYYARCVR
jgi:formylglycine-generating enzyme required for sulfatase activity